MARPTDWSPLAGSDPVPGVPQRIAEEAARLSSVAQEIQAQAARLRAIASGHSVEKGLHVDKLKSASADVADSLDKVIGRYQKTSAALSGWVPELEYAQSQSLKALAAAQDAAAHQKASQPLSYPPGYQETVQDKQNDQARANALNQANNDLAAARQMLDNATSYRDQKAAETANKIESAIHDGVTDSFWSDLGDFFSSIGNWVKNNWVWLVKDICTALEVLATILAIIALFIPGLDIIVLIGIALTAVALAGRVALAVTGNGSWLDVGLDALALLTFGAGKIIGGMLKGETAAARLAATAEQTSARLQMLQDAEPELDLFRSLITHDGPEVLSELGRSGVQSTLKAIAEATRLPEFGELGEGGLKAALQPEAIMEGLKTFLPRIAAGGDEFGRTTVQTLAYIGEHFPQVDISAAQSWLNIYRLNFGIGMAPSVIAQIAGGLEIDGPGGPTFINWHIPVIGEFWTKYVDGSWTTHGLTH
jgi:hypothetical protein